MLIQYLTHLAQPVFGKKSIACCGQERTHSPHSLHKEQSIIGVLFIFNRSGSL